MELSQRPGLLLAVFAVAWCMVGCKNGGVQSETSLPCLSPLLTENVLYETGLSVRGSEARVDLRAIVFAANHKTPDDSPNVTAVYRDGLESQLRSPAADQRWAGLGDGQFGHCRRSLA